MLDEHTCVCRNGAHYEDESPWYGPGRSLVVHASMRLMNQTVLPNLEYASGPNIWDKNSIGPDFDKIQVKVADNGFAQWNHSVRAHANFSPNLTHVSEVAIAVERENDPPVPVMPDLITIMQGERGRLTGGHFVDFDAMDFADDPFSIIYELGIEVGTGYVGLDMAAANCSIYFPPVTVLLSPLVALNVDARDDFKANAISSSNGLFLDGSEVRISSPHLLISCSGAPAVRSGIEQILEELRV
jgi:hypothetical protein